MRNKAIEIMLMAAAVCAAAPAREEYKRDFHKTANLPPGGAVRIEAQMGRVSVHARPGNDVQVQAAIRCSADTMDQARRWCDQIQIFFEQTAAGVYVRTDIPRLNMGGRNLSYAVDYDVLMPDKAALDLRNRFGPIDVSDLHASATIVNSNGTVAFLNGRGRQRIENSFGMVEVRRNEGDVVINTSNGPVIATDIGGTLEISNRFGEIRVTNVARGVQIRSNNSTIEVTGAGGPATISNSFGRVTISDVKADATVLNQNGEIDANGITGTAELHTSFAAIRFSRIGKAVTVHANNSLVRGDTVGESATVETTFAGVDLRDVKGGVRVTAGNAYIRLTGIGGEVYAKTSFAPVNVADAAGPVTVEGQNGAVTVVGRPERGCQPIALRTTFAPIRVTLPRGVGYDVTAHTTFGNIHTDASVVTAVTGNIGHDGLTGKIDGGGCPLKLSDQNGSIDILR
jgi:hypothetical protein